jgi:polyvinyl alcohol dehydrogenase (cytochrome)
MCSTKYGYSAAPLTIDGAVIVGSLDGKVLVIDGPTGKVQRPVDTTGPVKTLNGAPGKGGTIDAHGLSAGSGAVFVMSGSGSFDQTPGNVLIALKPRRGTR